MPTTCQGIAGRLLGHNFQPVFESAAIDLNLGSLKCSVHAALEIIDAMTPKRWVHTCCRRCGAPAPEQPARKA